MKSLSIVGVALLLCASLGVPLAYGALEGGTGANPVAYAQSSYYRQSGYAASTYTTTNSYTPSLGSLSSDPYKPGDVSNGSGGWSPGTTQLSTDSSGNWTSGGNSNLESLASGNSGGGYTPSESLMSGGGSSGSSNSSWSYTESGTGNSVPYSCGLICSTVKSVTGMTVEQAITTAKSAYEIGSKVISAAYKTIGQEPPSFATLPVGGTSAPTTRPTVTTPTTGTTPTTPPIEIPQFVQDQFDRQQAIENSGARSAFTEAERARYQKLIEGGISSTVAQGVVMGTTDTGIDSVLLADPRKANSDLSRLALLGEANDVETTEQFEKYGVTQDSIQTGLDKLNTRYEEIAKQGGSEIPRTQENDGVIEVACAGDLEDCGVSVPGLTTRPVQTIDMVVDPVTGQVVPKGTPVGTTLTPDQIQMYKDYAQGRMIAEDPAFINASREKAAIEKMIALDQACPECRYSLYLETTDQADGTKQFDVQLRFKEPDATAPEGYVTKPISYDAISDEGLQALGITQEEQKKIQDSQTAAKQEVYERYVAFMGSKPSPSTNGLPAGYTTDASGNIVPVNPMAAEVPAIDYTVYPLLSDNFNGGRYVDVLEEMKQDCGFADLGCHAENIDIEGKINKIKRDEAILTAGGNPNGIMENVGYQLGWWGLTEETDCGLNPVCNLGKVVYSVNESSRANREAKEATPVVVTPAPDGTLDAQKQAAEIVKQQYIDYAQGRVLAQDPNYINEARMAAAEAKRAFIEKECGDTCSTGIGVIVSGESGGVPTYQVVFNDVILSEDKTFRGVTYKAGVMNDIPIEILDEGSLNKIGVSTLSLTIKEQEALDRVYAKYSSTDSSVTTAADPGSVTTPENDAERIASYYVDYANGRRAAALASYAKAEIEAELVNEKCPGCAVRIVTQPGFYGSYTPEIITPSTQTVIVGAGEFTQQEEDILNASKVDRSCAECVASVLLMYEGMQEIAAKGGADAEKFNTFEKIKQEIDYIFNQQEFKVGEDTPSKDDDIVIQGGLNGININAMFVRVTAESIMKNLATGKGYGPAEEKILSEICAASGSICSKDALSESLQEDIRALSQQRQVTVPAESKKVLLSDLGEDERTALLGVETPQEKALYEKTVREAMQTQYNTYVPVRYGEDATNKQTQEINCGFVCEVVTAPFGGVQKAADFFGGVDYLKQTLTNLAKQPTVTVPLPDSEYIVPITGTMKLGASSDFCTATAFTSASDCPRGRSHGAVDLYAENASDRLTGPEAVVYAAQGGVVVRSQVQTNYGWTIDIKTPDGLINRYAHVSQFSPDGTPITVGMEIERGQPLTYVTGSGTNFGDKVASLSESGTNGQYGSDEEALAAAEAFYEKNGWGGDTPPHVHFEIRTDTGFGYANTLDPADYIPQLQDRNAVVVAGTGGSSADIVTATSDDESLSALEKFLKPIAKPALALLETIFPTPKPAVPEPSSDVVVADEPGTPAQPKPAAPGTPTQPKPTTLVETASCVGGNLASFDIGGAAGCFSGGSGNTPAVSESLVGGSGSSYKQGTYATPTPQEPVVDLSLEATTATKGANDEYRFRGFLTRNLATKDGLPLSDLQANYALLVKNRLSVDYQCDGSVDTQKEFTLPYRSFTFDEDESSVLISEYLAVGPSGSHCFFFEGDITNIVREQNEANNRSSKQTFIAQ